MRTQAQSALISLTIAMAMVGCQGPGIDEVPGTTNGGEEPGAPEPEEVLEAPADPSVAPAEGVSATAVEFGRGSLARIVVTWAGGPLDTPTFTIERSTDRKKWSKLGVTYSREFSDVTARRGTEYHYRIKAHDSRATARPSNIASARLREATGFRKTVLDIPMSSYTRSQASGMAAVTFTAPDGSRVTAGFAGTSNMWRFEIATGPDETICVSRTTIDGTSTQCDEERLRRVAGTTATSAERFIAQAVAPFLRDQQTITGVRNAFANTFGKTREPRVRAVCVGTCESLWEGFDASLGEVVGRLCNFVAPICEKGINEAIGRSDQGCAEECDDCLDQWVAFCANPNYRGPGGLPEPPRYCHQYADGCRGTKVVLRGGRVLID